jgi:ribulose-bisphosphate carboxylase large chain
VIEAVYRLAPLGRGTPDDGPTLRALALARESTLEVPEGVASDRIEAELLGRVVDVRPAAAPAGSATVSAAGALETPGAHLATIHYPVGVLDGGLPQLLNVLHGNVSLLPGVRLVDVALPAAVLDGFGGPRFGIEGVRERAGATAGRPLVAAALKPVGLTTAELARLAAAFARAGVDVVKDDHGVTDQAPSPFADRVRAVVDAVAEVNASTGGATAYYVNVTGPVERIPERVARAAEVGCGGVLVAPGLVGLDTMRVVVESEPGLPVMAHPSRGDVGPDRDSGISPEVWYGLFYRLAGADVVVYVNAGGRFAWSLGTCQALNGRLRAPLGRLRPSLPSPAGGVNAADAPAWFERYGPDTLLLVGGSLLAQDDVEGAARRLVEQARAYPGS